MQYHCKKFYFVNQLETMLCMTPSITLIDWHIKTFYTVIAYTIYSNFNIEQCQYLYNQESKTTPHFIFTGSVLPTCITGVRMHRSCRFPYSYFLPMSYNIFLFCYTLTMKDHSKPRVLLAGVILCFSNVCFCIAKLSSCYHFCLGFGFKVTKSPCNILYYFMLWSWHNLMISFYLYQAWGSQHHKERWIGKSSWNHCQCGGCHSNYSLQRSPSSSPADGPNTRRHFRSRSINKDAKLDLGLHILAWTLSVMGWLDSFSGLVNANDISRIYKLKFQSSDNQYVDFVVKINVSI